MQMTDCSAILDGDHLARMTLGDRALAREVLTLFAVQSGELVRAISAESEASAAAAHKLKGSARAVGAFALESAVVTYEEAVAKSADTMLGLDILNRRLAEAELAIDTYLQEGRQVSAEQLPAAGVRRMEPL